jgi:hypothetical protein
VIAPDDNYKSEESIRFNEEPIEEEIIAFPIKLNAVN